MLLAYRRAAKGKRNRPAAAAFEYRLEDQLLALQEELRSRTYGPGPYTSFYIHEPKRRLISAAPFRDRVVHHALCNVIEPIFERSFIDDSYANRIGKGTHRALNRAQELARRYRYVLQCDIRQFFPSIDHAILRDTLAQKIADEHVRWLVEHILASGQGVLSEEYTMVYFQGDDLFAANRPRGLPIGNLTSQFWANVYLNPFDHFVKRTLHCPGYVRYVDDMLLFADEKALLWRWKTAVQQRLAALRVTIHEGAHPRPVTEGVPFLGFVVFPQHRRLKRRKGVYFQRHFRQLLREFATKVIPLARVTVSVRGWVNHVRYGNTVGLRKAILGFPEDVIASKGGSSMPLTPETWKAQLPELLRNWRQRMVEFGVNSAYASLGAMTLWPVAQAIMTDGVSAWAALGTASSAVGASLLAAHVKQWRDERHAAQDLASHLSQNTALRDELTSILKSLDVTELARQVLPETERAWFDDTLRQERQRYGMGSTNITALGTSVVATHGGMAGGAGSVVVKGDVHGSISIGGAKKGE